MHFGKKKLDKQNEKNWENNSLKCCVYWDKTGKIRRKCQPILKKNALFK